MKGIRKGFLEEVVSTNAQTLARSTEPDNADSVLFHSLRRFTSEKLFAVENLSSATVVVVVGVMGRAVWCVKCQWNGK